MHYNYPRIGGVKRDIPIGFADRMIAKVKLFERRIDEYEMMLDESTIWLVRLQGVGYANAEEMVERLALLVNHYSQEESILRIPLESIAHLTSLRHRLCEYLAIDWKLVA